MPLITCAYDPLPYVVTHVSERYRFPIEPLLVLAACWLFARRDER